MEDSVVSRQFCEAASLMKMISLSSGLSFSSDLGFYVCLLRLWSSIDSSGQVAEYSRGMCHRLRTLRRGGSYVICPFRSHRLDSCLAWKVSIAGYGMSI